LGWVQQNSLSVESSQVRDFYVSEVGCHVCNIVHVRPAIRDDGSSPFRRHITMDAACQVWSISCRKAAQQILVSLGFVSRSVFSAHKEDAMSELQNELVRSLRERLPSLALLSHPPGGPADGLS
jgi:hypothetical protein